MKKISISVTLRAGMATALCFSFIIYPPLRLSSAGADTDTNDDMYWCVFREQD